VARADGLLQHDHSFHIRRVIGLSPDACGRLVFVMRAIGIMRVPSSCVGPVLCSLSIQPRQLPTREHFYAGFLR
jgi:hypothetical protein